MVWIIGFLTAILILDCLFLVLLILVQLPKKEAGLGQAFGGATTDALFGAGSGNALTKLTKYATVTFLVITLSLSILNAHNKNRPSRLQENMQKVGSKGEAALPPTTGVTPVGTNITGQPEAVETNLVSSNAAPKAPSTTVSNAPAPSTPAAPAPSASTSTNTPSTEKPK